MIVITVARKLPDYMGRKEDFWFFNGLGGFSGGKLGLCGPVLQTDRRA